MQPIKGVIEYKPKTGGYQEPTSKEVSLNEMQTINGVIKYQRIK